MTSRRHFIAGLLASAAAGPTTMVGAAQPGAGLCITEIGLAALARIAARGDTLVIGQFIVASGGPRLVRWTDQGDLSDWSPAP